MRRFWLLFAQTVTIALALYFVYGALRPASRVQQLGSPAKPVPVVETASSSLAPGSYRDAAARAMPAVVNILTLQVPKRGAHPLARDPFFKRFFGERDPDDGDGEDLKNSLGSGVIVSHEGYVLTNNHVVEGADEIEVVLTDGRKAPAKIVGLDPETDLAVIKINLDKLPVIVLGQSELARVGDVVLAIGNPFGVGQTVTMGIISALGRNNLHINSFENFIQTDAAINFGNSGGALVDTRGNLIGINTAIYSQSGGSVGIGFAIPVSTAKTVMEAIIKDGHVVRGWIGVETQDITPDDMRRPSKAGGPTYYLQIDGQGNLLFGAGEYMPPPGRLKALREHMVNDAPGFSKVLKNKRLKARFGTIQNEGKLQRPPKGFDADAEHIEFIKLKSLI